MKKRQQCHHSWDSLRNTEQSKWINSNNHSFIHPPINDHHFQSFIHLLIRNFHLSNKVILWIHSKIRLQEPSNPKWLGFFKSYDGWSLQKVWIRTWYPRFCRTFISFTLGWWISESTRKRNSWKNSTLHELNGTFTLYLHWSCEY